MKIAFITGASKGFGRALALTIAQLSSGDMVFHLSGRNHQELLSLSEELTSISARFEVIVLPIDLGDVAILPEVSCKMFENHLSLREAADEIIFIANAGSLGALAPIGSESFTIQSISNAINLNVTSFCYLTSEFVRRVKSLNRFQEQRLQVTIVNISSLAALQAFESWSIYCAGKAARDMYYQVLAKELTSQGLDKFIKVLNYAPGPLDTDMQKQIRENPEVDSETQAFYRKMKENNQLIQPIQSAEKLVKLLNSKVQWANGSHVDFFDV